MACRNCNVVGHFARDCPKRRQTAMRCFTCSQVGHASCECPQARQRGPPPQAVARHQGSASRGGPSTEAAGRKHRHRTAVHVCGPIAKATKFFTVVDILGVVVVFCSGSEFAETRLVCGRWNLAACEQRKWLKCKHAVTSALLIRMVAAFPELVTLDLTGCDRLQAPAFAQLASLVGLRTLKLEGDRNTRGFNITEEALDRVSRIPSLTALDVSCCNGLTTVGLEKLSRLRLLVSLVLNDCKLHDVALGFLAQLPRLTTLNVATCNLREDAINQICEGACGLMFLDARGLRIGESGVVALARLPALHTLLVDVTGSGVQELHRLRALQSLSLKCAGASDAWLHSIGSLTAVTSLDLMWSCVAVTDVGVASLGGLTRLEYLSLYGCILITDAALASVGQMKALKTLELGNVMNITDAGLAQLRGLSNLRRLDLFQCRSVTSTGLALLRAANPDLAISNSVATA